MADFSFSFDSDNPFAEPESAPQTAPAKTDAASSASPATNGRNDDAVNESATHEPESESDDLNFSFDEDEFSLDSLPEQTSSAAASEVAMPDTSAPDTSAPDAAASEADLNFDFFSPQQETRDTPPPLHAHPEEFAAIASPGSDTESEAPDSDPASIAFVPDEDDFSDWPSTGESASGESEAESLKPETAAFEFLASEAPAAPAETFAPAQDEEEDDDEVTRTRRHEPLPQLSVAILGASGIGKNHARWFHRNGCRVTSFLGTTSESIERTSAEMSADFEFDGTAYTDLETLLATEKPDVVCVATPPALHFGHVLQALEAGAHVLCEKPLVYAPTRKFRENRDGAKELVKVAAKKNLVLGTQLQYGAATPILCKLAGIAPTEVGDFAMEIETVNPHSSRDPRELWIDLGPHPVSIAQILAGPGSKLDESSISFDPHQSDQQSEALVRFSIDCADGRLLMVRAVVRVLNPELIKRKPRRRFSFNGHPVTYAPVAGRRGLYQAQFVGPDGYASVYPDPVDWLIGNFVGACQNQHPLVISGDFGRENLEWMLKIGTPTDTR